ncbi:MAG: sigma-70 family RNA polymerase sigma factor [Defluviitaleaceae bacterium]|nr:sigma-70 family RNA polymerase sigma factor [Defluviitaleaceae bacterium]
MTDNRTDIQLIEECLVGQQEAFAELISRYKNLVYSIILRMTKDKEEANDLAQDVFLKMYKNLASYSPEFKFSTWTMRITTNHVIDFHRKKKQETVPLEDVSAVIAADIEDAPEAVVLRNEERARIQGIVDDLPAMYKIPIVLYHQQGMSYQEIADEINEPLSKVKNRIFRGRKILKARYVEEGR